MSADLGHWTYRPLARGEYEIIDPAGQQQAMVAMPPKAERQHHTMLSLTRTFARLHGGTVSHGGRVYTDDDLDVLIAELDAGAEIAERSAA